MEILEVELGHSADINVDIIENPDTAILEVYWQDEVELNYDLDVQFIKNGEREIDSYVVNVVKPEISEYAEEVATQYVQQYASTTINNYVESVTKPDIDDYTDAKLTAFNTNATAKTDDFNTLASTSTTEFNTNADAKTDNFNNLASISINNFNQNATEKTNAYNTLAQSSEEALVQYVNSANASAITATTQAGIATNQADIATSKASESLASANASASSAISANNSAEQAEEALKSITGVYRVKGSVATYNDLPSVGQKVGDVYNVLDSGANYVWTDNGWDKLSETVDLSKYALKTELPTIARANVPGLVAGGNWLTVNQTTGKMECGELTKAQYDSALGYTFISKTTLNNVLKEEAANIPSMTLAEYNALPEHKADQYYAITDDTDTGTDLLQMIYPVGSLYLTTNATCPLANLFGTWTLVSQDRVLQGAGSRGSVGTTINESLPNIRGGFYVRDLYEVESGALYRDNSKTSGGYYGSNSAPATGGMMFDASRSSSTYQDNAPVQQNAYLINVFRRIE